MVFDKIKDFLKDLTKPIKKQEDIGDLLQIIIPSLTMYYSKSRWHYLKNYLITVSIVSVLKNITDVLRPNSTASSPDRNSFPSGHTASAFMGADYYYKNIDSISLESKIYYLLALYTGYTRIDANKHRLVDIIGAIIVVVGVNHYNVP